jgi:hypothetical protein
MTAGVSVPLLIRAACPHLPTICPQFPLSPVISRDVFGQLGLTFSSVARAMRRVQS